MEKYSKWRDPATGIQPFLPPQPPSSAPVLALLAPLRLANALIMGVLLAAVALVHLLVVDGVCLVLTPLPPLHRAVSGAVTAVTCRLALSFMGFYWIRAEMTSPKRGTGIAQTIRSSRRGDLILCNWTSYIDVLYLAFRHNPVFLLPVFAPAPPSDTPALTGRHTGTGSAQIASAPLPQPPLIGYQPIPLLALLLRTGSLPTTHAVPPRGTYKSLRDARRLSSRPVCLLPEGTTSNGRAVLRLPEGILAPADFDLPPSPGVAADTRGDGIVWVNFIRHSPPTSLAPSTTCSLPTPLAHLLLSTLYTLPLPLGNRELTVRTLHPSNAPSSPSFLPSDILAGAPGGLEGVRDDAVWREAVASVMAETGRVRRVRGMGWVEKEGFLEYHLGRGQAQGRGARRR